MDILIVGGGYSGIISAIKLKKDNPNINVTILEKNNEIGKKILKTGNGRCNILNKSISSEFYNTSKIKNILEEFDLDNQIRFLKSIGIFIDFEEDRGYPFSYSAKALLELLKIELKSLKISIYLNEEVKKIKNINNKYHIYANNNYISDIVVISTGSITENNLVYNLKEKITKPQNSLTGFKVFEKLENISGVRVNSKVYLMDQNNKIIHQETGQVQIKKDGFSGICIMNLSSFYNENTINLKMDLFSNYEINELVNILNEYNCLKYKFFNLFPPKLASYFYDKNKNNNLDEIAFNFKNWNFKIKGLYDDYQVIKGGIDLDELDNLESKVSKKIFYVGEILNVDGLCGGYNLSWALVSSLYVCKIINKKYLKK